MKEFSNTDTIVAIATPSGAGGIGIVRMSGPLSTSILSKIWQGKSNPENFEPRKLYLGSAITHGGPIDRIMAVVMPAPATYTGENMVEISAHGSPIVLQEIQDSCVKNGARMAGPGEFTRRAFLAGKIDLTQAEAVADLINATSERAARVAGTQLDGCLGKTITDIANVIADIRAEIEATIDFPEEDIEPKTKTMLADKTSEIILKTKNLTDTFKGGHVIKDGVRVAIVGSPNAGKSSIFNRLVGFERAIVHHEPGTTRDVVEESIVLDGIVFRLRDTAGLRNSDNAVEEMGIIRTRQETESADLIIVVIDGQRGVTKNDTDIINDLSGKDYIVVINKIDVGTATFLKGENSKNRHIFISALTGEGFDKLSQEMSSIVSINTGFAEGAYVTNLRHKTLLEETMSALMQANDAIASNKSPEFAALHLLAAQDALGNITGVVTTDDILDRIFSKFCIGK